MGPPRCLSPSMGDFKLRAPLSRRRPFSFAAASASRRRCAHRPPRPVGPVPARPHASPCWSTRCRHRPLAGGAGRQLQAAGLSATTRGRISKQGSFYQRLRARRGAQITLVATARKLCVVFWHLLTREQDYAFGRPSLTRHKLRRLELIAGDPSHRGRRSGSAASKREQAHERELSEQFERALSAARVRLAAGAEEKGRRRDTGARISWAVKGPSSAAGISPRTCALARRQDRRPGRTLANWRLCV